MTGSAEILQLIQSGDYSQAKTLLQQQLASGQDSSELRCILGVCEQQLGNVNIAIAHYRAGLALDEANERLWRNLLVAEGALGNLSAELATAQEAVAHCPRSQALAAAMLNALLKNGQADATHAMLGRLPEDWLATESFKLIQALALRGLGRDAEALSHLDGCSGPLVQFNKALILQSLGELDEALVILESLAKSGQLNLDGLNSLGVVNRDLGRAAEAETCFSQALLKRPQFADAAFNLACIQLAKANWQEGWRHFAARWQTGVYQNLWWEPGGCEWRPEQDAPAKLLVWSEQGVGDVVLYARVFECLRDRDIQIVLVADGRLARLLERAFPYVRVYTKESLPAECAHWPHLPLGNLLARFCTSNTAIANVVPYLRADVEAATSCRQRYLDIAQGRKIIGFSWFSNNAAKGNRKTVDLAEWEPLLRTPHIVWVNLQYGDHDAEIARAREAYGAEIIQDHEIDPIADLNAFANQVAACDAVVTTPNATADFAGALAKPLWMLVNRSPDWRWQLDGQQTPWYPSATIFRQQTDGNWAPAISALAASLTQWLQTSDAGTDTSNSSVTDPGENRRS